MMTSTHTGEGGAVLWHLLFFGGLSTPDRWSTAVEALAMLEAVGFTEAGASVQRLLDTHTAGDCDASLFAPPSPAESASWLGTLRLGAMRQAKVVSTAPSTKSSASGTVASLAAVLAEVQHQHREGGATARSSATVHDSLFDELADDFLRHAASGAIASGDATQPRAGIKARVSVFECAPSPALPSTATSTAATSPPAAVPHALHHWYAARLYAAVACSTSLATPGPLARLLVAYVHHDDGRLQAVVRDNIACRRSSPHLQEPGTPFTGDKVSSSDAAVVSARTRGVVAGILEYALSVARVQTAVAVSALRASTSAGSAAAVASAPLECRSGTRHAPQSAAVLLRAVTEEVGHYTRAAGDGDAALAVVHAMQELLFTVVLGGGTSHMRNRPEPSAAPARRLGLPHASASASAGAAFPLSVTTARGTTLAEADVIAQELFPALVQQLGLEWPWSPLLRHLASLDKQQPAVADVEGTDAAAWVRWSSHALMDAVLLALSRKTYPQRLLNILPGSYERLLSNLDLLPPMPPQGEESDNATGGGGGHGSAAAGLFEVPAYYAEPAAALLSYFRRAGVAGLRVEEVERVLGTATSTHAMVVRLRAQAPSRHGAGGHRGASGDDEGDEESGWAGGRSGARAYALTRERVDQLVCRYQAEVLLAAVVVHTQLRVPSQVQQLMRALAPLFLKIHLDWRTHHDGSSAAWLLQPDTAQSGSGGGGGSGVAFSAEAVVLMDHVGYEFYPLEWLPAALRQLTRNGGTAELPVLFPYSLCAAVGHQFQLRLWGTPSGSTGDAALRHPAGPRTSVVMLTPPGMVLRDGRVVEEASDAAASAAAWRRTERFLVGFMQLCYLDAKTSSTELEGTLAVSSTRRVLTTSNRGAGGAAGSAGVGDAGAGGGPRAARVVAAADVATHRLHALLQQPAVMNAMWGAMDGTTTAAAASPLARHARLGQRREKRPRAAASTADTVAHLQAMQQLLHEYGAVSFDTTVEAADFALVVAQAFLPSSAGMSAPLTTAAAAAAGKSAVAPVKPSAALLRAALEWARAVALHGPNKARVNMLLQQQYASESHRPTSMNAVLRHAYNSVTVDAAWLARCVLRYVPQRIWEKMRADQAERLALAERLNKWTQRARDAVVGDDDDVADKLSAAAAVQRVSPLLREQWTQWERVLQQLGLSERAEENSGGFAGAAVAAATSSASPYTADNISWAQWMWYSPYFAAEMSV